MLSSETSFSSITLSMKRNRLPAAPPSDFVPSARADRGQAIKKKDFIPLNL